MLIGFNHIGLNYIKARQGTSTLVDDNIKYLDPFFGVKGVTGALRMPKSPLCLPFFIFLPSAIAEVACAHLLSLLSDFANAFEDTRRWGTFDPSDTLLP